MPPAHLIASSVVIFGMYSIGHLYGLSIGTPFCKGDKMLYMGKDIGLRLRRARKDAGLSQVELAARTGLKQGSISDLERGESRTMRGPTLMAVSRALGVREEWLLTGKGEQYSTYAADDPVRKLLTPEAIKLIKDWRKLTPEVRSTVAEMIRTMVVASVSDRPAVADEKVAAAYGKPQNKPRQ